MKPSVFIHFMQAGKITSQLLALSRSDLEEIIKIKSTCPPELSDAAKRLADESLAELKLLLFLRDELEKVRIPESERKQLIKAFEAELPASARILRDALLGKGGPS